MSEFNHETKSETTLDNFKEELSNTVVKFGEPVLMGTGLDEKARKELLSRMVKLGETRQKTKDDKCKDGSTLKKKTDDKLIKVEGDDMIKTSNMIKSTDILKARAGGGGARDGRVGPGRRDRICDDSDDTPSKGMKSRRRKREMEELSSPSVDAVSEKNLRETAPMILARWRTAAYKSSSEPRRLTDIVKEIEVSTSLLTEEDFKPQNIKRISSEHQAIGKQVSNDPLEKNATRNTARPWWVALETMKELEDCLKKLDQGVSRKVSQLGSSTESRSQQVRIGKSAKANLAEPVAGLFWGGDENTFISIASDGESLRQNRGTTDVRVEASGNRNGDLEFM